MFTEILNAQNAAQSKISAAQIVDALRPGVNFAALDYCVELNTSAANRAVKLRKAVRSNVQIFASIKDYDLYRKQVLRSANKLSDSEITEYVVSDTYFEHTQECFSIVQHKKDSAKQYLYVVVNSAESQCFVNDVAASKEDTASYMTKSDAAKLLNTSSTVYSVKNDVTHDVTLRTIMLSNLVRIAVNKQVIAIA
jgi:hypothetical protein